MSELPQSPVTPRPGDVCRKVEVEVPLDYCLVLIQDWRDLVSITDRLQKEHAELKKFTAGFAKPGPCDCDACVKARRVLVEAKHG